MRPELHKDLGGGAHLPPKYVGETGRMLKARLSDHRGYISNQVVAISTGDHFNLPGHSLAPLNITILERVKEDNENYRKKEKHILSTNLTHSTRESIT